MPRPLTITHHRLKACNGCRLSLLDPARWLATTLPVFFTYRDMNWEETDTYTAADVVIIEGAVTDAVSKHVLTRIRECCSVVIVLGDCAIEGIVLPPPLPPPSNRGGQMLAGPHIRLPLRSPSPMASAVPDTGMSTGDRYPVERFITIDYRIHGCPPPMENVQEVLLELSEQHERGEALGRKI